MPCQVSQENIMSQQISTKIWMKYAVLAGSFIFCYAKIFAALTETWWNNDVYTHGFLVPFVSIYFVWIGRTKLDHIKPSPSYFIGLPVLLGSLLMLLMGHAGGVLLIQEISIIVSIAGIILFLFGMRYLVALWFPVAYLFFMIPFLRFFPDNIYLPFQLFTAKMAVTLLHTMGISCLRNSTYIELPNIILEVVPACSGLNYLISIIATGIPLAYISLRSWSRRITLVVMGIAIAILSNGLRVALIGLLAYYNIGGDLHGPYHTLQAMFVAVFGYGALFIGAWALAERPRSSSVTSLRDPALSFRGQAPYFPQKLDAIRCPLIFTIIVLLSLGAYINFNFYQSLPVKLHADINLIPHEIGEWRGVDSATDYKTFRTLGVDHDLSRTYRTAAGKEVKLYIGYYESQGQGKELINYQSEWLHINADKMRIALSPDKEFEVNKMIQREGPLNKLTLFWYDLNGRIVTDKHEAKAYTTWDAITKRRSNGAIIIVSGDFSQTEDELAVLKNEEEFVKKLMPILHNYVP